MKESKEKARRELIYKLASLYIPELLKITKFLFLWVMSAVYLLKLRIKSQFIKIDLYVNINSIFIKAVTFPKQKNELDTVVHASNPRHSRG